MLLPLACNKPATDQTGTDDPLGGLDPTTYYANLFAFNHMKAYYLWADEMAAEIDRWKYGDDPIEKVKACRYNADSRLVDKWTARDLPDGEELTALMSSEPMEAASSASSRGRLAFQGSLLLCAALLILL